MSYREQSKQFHLCICQNRNHGVNLLFPTLQRRQLFRGWVPLATSLVVPHLLYHFRQLFCRYFFGIFDLRAFIFVCHTFTHSNKIIEIRGLKQTVVHRGGQILQNPTGFVV
uniref:Uncharacterized protein n=1 Tax=Siphoviridae sp. ctrok7 TaxID=2826480 RepID=A0A8S5NDU9_9CAUD|nr:MAG TPA: hypothetical protein [Siphoviridae sp. ctrok7]